MEEQIKYDISKCISKKDFQEKFGKSYRLSMKLGIYKDLTKHFKRPKNKRIIWDIKKLIKFRNDCNTLDDFYKELGAVNRSKILGIYKKITERFDRKKRSSKYNIKTLRKIASKYNTRTEFFKFDKGAYVFASKNDLLSRICNNMEYVNKNGNKPRIDRIITLYYIKIYGLYKIGWTSTSIEIRFGTVSRDMKIVAYWQWEDGMIPYKIEKDILLKFKEFKYNGPKILKNGNTELFIKDILNLDHI